MIDSLPDIRNIDVSGKTVFVRLDLDVPLCKDEIEDETRLIAGLPTVQYLLEQGAKVIIGGKLGRPKGFDKLFSLAPATKWFAEKFKFNGSSVIVQDAKIGEFPGWKLTENLFLLENLQFYEGEVKNDLEFSKKLASLAEIYVNDAFAMCHRDNASITGIAKLLPHFAGFHLQKEVSELGSLLQNPKRPLVVLIGGAKIETKLPLVEKMHSFADYVLVGGKIASESKELIKEQHRKIPGRKSVLFVADLNNEGTDITSQDSENFLQIINLAKTIIWNGPMGLIRLECRIKNGVIEDEESERGTRVIAQGIARINAYKVAGGGDTVEFLQKLKLTNKFDFVSTGGGAMLSFLSGEKLPGLEALTC
ncbi:MAG: phosphoglycerate kinase [Candidatus Levybacteria bacterium]|nr:phosphoglycerate kinase [Candidatus Levybacteria bacterium]